MPEATSVIHDIGYQRYEGPRHSRRHIAAALYLHSLRTAFGLGRSAKAKVFPWLIVSIVTLVAVVLAAVRAQINPEAVTYAQFPQVQTLLIIFFCAVVGPELVSRDLHSGVLPLYFARPLRVGDYVTAKLAALITATFLLVAGPLTVMFAATAFDVNDLSALGRELIDYLLAQAYTAVYAVVFASVALLVSSFIRRRAVAAAATVAVFLLTTPVVGVLSVLPSQTATELAGLASPTTLVGGVGDWLFEPGGENDVGPFGPLYAVVALALVAGCVLLLFARYRKVSSS
ncbi:MAG TPA: ABC transporter permease subunit [Micromonosporaceae bacterium]|nr:ABC transporter permease subunit [Micromonosporaceae bacterium]